MTVPPLDPWNFLNARLDEHEARARDRLCVNCGEPTAPLRSAVGITGYTHGAWRGARCPGRVTGAEPVQDPARVLRDVAAKRAILAAHSPEATGKYGAPEPRRCATCLSDRERYPDDWSGDPWPCRTLRHLLEIWDDHPDYEQKWMP